VDSSKKHGDGRRASSDANVTVSPISPGDRISIRAGSSLAAAAVAVNNHHTPPSSTDRSSAEASSESAQENTAWRRRADAWNGQEPADTSSGKTLNGGALGRRKTALVTGDTLSGKTPGDETTLNSRTLSGRAARRNSTGVPSRNVSRSEGADHYELEFASADAVIAVLGSCALIVHLQPVTHPVIHAMARAYGKASSRAEKFGHVCIIEPNAGLLPPGDIRPALGDLIQRFDKRLAAAAIIYEENGFMATAVRSIVTGICMVSRTTHPSRVFANAVNACAWVGAALPGPGAPRHSELLQSLRELRLMGRPSAPAVP
jgi:hypothetical protein